MSVKRPGVQSDLKPAFVWRGRPLGQSDLALVELEVAAIAPAWSVELHAIGLGEARLVLLPEGADDDNGPSFVISREDYGLRLDHVHWDEMTEIGVFSSMPELLAALRAWLSLASRPASVTLH